MVVAMEIELKNIGTTSFTYKVNFINYQTQQLLAIGEITYVMVSANQHHKTPIPSTVRQLIENGANGIVDHTGVSN